MFAVWLLISYQPVAQFSMLGGSLVIMAWHALRLQMEETASGYGG
jgi:hypothetical protein